MKIKKPVTVKTQANTAAAPGGAAIADRLRLDPVDTTKPKAGGTVNKKAAMWALIAGSIALVITIALAVMLYKHWEYLMPA